MATEFVNPFKKEEEFVNPFLKEEEFVNPFKSKEEDEGIGIGENIWRTAVGALRDVGQGIIDFTDWTESKIPTALQAGLVKTEEDGYQVLTGKEYVNAKESLRSKGIKSINLPKVPEPEYFGGSFIRDLTGFVLPFSQLKLLNATSVLGKGAEIVARGTVAEQLAFSPFEQRLSNLAAEYGPEFSKPLANYLKADINDTESEARFKMAIEGTILGGTIESVIALAKSVKNMRSVGKKEAVKTKDGKTITEEPPKVEEIENLSQRIEEIDQPIVIKDTPISNVGPDWKGQYYHKIANAIINYTSKKFPKWDATKTLPLWKKFMELRYRTMGKAGEVKELADDVFKKFSLLDEADNIKVHTYLTKPTQRNLDELVDPILKKNAQTLRKAIDKVGQKSVDAGLLTKEQMKKFKGEYLPRAYLKYRGKSKYTKQRKMDLPEGMDIKTLKAQERKKYIDELTKEFLGEIKDVSLLGAKAIQNPMEDIIRRGYFRNIAQEAEWTYPKGMVTFNNRKMSPVAAREEMNRITQEIKDNLRPKSNQSIVRGLEEAIKKADENIDIAKLDNFRKLPDTNYYGSLKGAYVRKEIYDDIKLADDFANNNDNLALSFLGDKGLVSKGTKLWKFNKVALNIPTIVRNNFSNAILLVMSGVRWRDLPKLYWRAMKDIANNGPFTQIAKTFGVNDTNFANQELVRWNTMASKVKAAKGNFVDKIKHIGAVIGEWGNRGFQYSELLGKTVKIMDEMAKGVSEADAVLAAQKTLFDYSFVPPSVRYLRNAPVGMPFITFYYKVLPNLLETAIRTPERYLPFIAIPYAYHAVLAKYQGVTKEDFDAFKKTLPEYLRDRGNAFIMPVKDDSGRWQAFDFSYFLPWSMFTGAIKDAADGDIQRFFVDTGMLGGPLPQLITAVLANKDPFTQRPIANPYDPYATQVADSMMYLWRMSMPTWLTDIGFAGKMKQALDKDVNKYGDPKITMTQAALRLVGMNVYPLDPQKSRSQNIKNMKYELQQIKSRRTKTLKDRNLTQEERNKIRNKYNDLIKQRIEQLREYREESTIPKELR